MIEFLRLKVMLHRMLRGMLQSNMQRKQRPQRMQHYLGNATIATGATNG